MADLGWSEVPPGDIVIIECSREIRCPAKARNMRWIVGLGLGDKKCVDTVTGPDDSLTLGASHSRWCAVRRSDRVTEFYLLSITNSTELPVHVLYCTSPV